MSATLAALLSHWRRHPLQLAALVVGLALATALWSGVQALNAEGLTLIVVTHDSAVARRARRRLRLERGTVVDITD